MWVSPRLELNDERVPLSLVEEPVLAITSTDRHGTESSREVTGFELHDEQESTFTFRVPDDLARIAFTVRGRLQTMTGDRVDVSASGGVSLNGIETTDRTRDLHLARTAEGWVLSLLGKNGEPRADVALNVRLRSRWVTFELDETLQTDARGRIELGTLPDVTFLRASTPDGYEGRWDLERGWSELPTAVHARVGEAVRIPAPVGTTCTRDCLALLEGTFGGQAKAVYAKAKYSKSGSKRAPAASRRVGSSPIGSRPSRSSRAPSWSAGSARATTS